MSNRSSEQTPAATGTVDRPPCLPPLEIIEPESEWLVREYHLRGDDATVFDRCDDRLDAMRVANDKMHADRHPCLLRWDDDDIVGDLYWNELFEELCVEYSDLLDAWVVVPAADHFVFESGSDIEAVCNAARAVQRQYEFKEIAVFDKAGNRRETFDHRFIRHDIAASGVRFKRDQPLASPDESATEESDDEEPTASPTSTLIAAVPDLTELEELETSGAVFQYRATWDNDQLSRIELLNPAYVANRDVVKQFTGIVDDWQTLSEHPTVATVFEIGPSPAAWIAYEASAGTVDDHLPRLDREARLQIIDDVATAIEQARGEEIRPTQITPATVRVRDTKQGVRGALAGWGLQWETERLLGSQPVTPYTAPEQIPGESQPTTPIYQLGALAYRLLCETAPFDDAASLARAISRGSVRTPSEQADLPSSVDSVLRQAMSPIPEQRYTRASTVSEKLQDALQ